MGDFDSITELKARGLSDALKAVDGPTGLSRAMGGTPKPQAISQWKQVPAERALSVEKVTGVSRHRLRPDIYPSDERAA